MKPGDPPKVKEWNMMKDSREISMSFLLLPMVPRIQKWLAEILFVQMIHFLYMVYEEHQGEIHNYIFWFSFARNEGLCFWLKTSLESAILTIPWRKDGNVKLFLSFGVSCLYDQVTFIQMLVWGITKTALYSNEFHNIKNRKRLRPGILLLLFIWSLSLPS